MSKPTFVCIPGPSHPAVVYAPLEAALSLHGYTTNAVQLPSTGGNPPTYDFTEDVAVIRNVIFQLVQSSLDIIVVMHTWSGVAGSEAVQGLGKLERQQRGLRGGVIRLVFIMGWIVKEGFQGAPRGDVSALFPYMVPDLQVSEIFFVLAFLVITNYICYGYSY